jgi:hypothetical protein
MYHATLEDLGRKQAAVMAIKPEGPELTESNLLGYLVWPIRDRR